MRKVNRLELASLLNNNVCEIIFVRRKPERTLKRNKLIRRMLCCNSKALLDSLNGRTSLGYRPPKGPKKINEAKHNVVVTWDIFMQDYRNVSMDICYLVNQFPADDTFWKYFNDNIYIMSAGQKENFMETIPQ
jgi:hypothetical protein